MDTKTKTTTRSRQDREPTVTAETIYAVQILTPVKLGKSFTNKSKIINGQDGKLSVDWKTQAVILEEPKRKLIFPFQSIQYIEVVDE